jgi:tetratricopeptide (TPR) repeat protein
LHYLLSAKTLFAAQDYQQAARDSRKSLDQAPTAEASLLLGQTLEKLGKTKEALRQYEATLQLDPQSAEAYRFLADLRLETGDSTAAFDAFLKHFELSSRSPREVLTSPAYADLVGYYFSKRIESLHRRQALALAIQLRHKHVPYLPLGKSPEAGFDALGFVLYVLQKSGMSGPLPRTLNDLETLFPSITAPESMDLIIIRGRVTLPLFYIGEFFGESLCIGVGPTAFVEIVDRKQLLGGLVTYHRIPF